MFSHIPTPTTEELRIAGYINEIQFMGDCWSRDFTYPEYAFHAKRINKHVFTEAEYKAHCDSCHEQMVAYFAE